MPADALAELGTAFSFALFVTLVLACFVACLYWAVRLAGEIGGWLLVKLTARRRGW